MSHYILPNNCLILVATGAEAKLFRSQNGSLKADGHWTPQNLADEGPSGKSPPEQSDRESMEATFSKQIAERLYSMAHDGRYDDLVLIADPDTLGEVRPLLHLEVTSKIKMEMDKTLINSTIEDIEKSIGAAQA